MYNNTSNLKNRNINLMCYSGLSILIFVGRFIIQRQKETTGRVVFWNMGMTCSYTMEASYGGTNLGSRAFTHFTTDDYEGMGR